MKGYITFMLVVSALIFMSLSPVHADVGATVSVHDVVILGTAVNDLISKAPAPQGTNCVRFVIGTAAGTNYTSSGGVTFNIAGADGANPAVILAVENGVAPNSTDCSLLGFAQNASRDQLLLNNVMISLPNSATSQSIAIDFQGDFGPTPNTTVTFSDTLKGQFLKSGNGSNCLGSGCAGTTTVKVINLSDNSSSSSVSKSCTYPLGSPTGTCMGTASVSFNPGSGNRTHTAHLQITLPDQTYAFTNAGSIISVQSVPRKHKSKNLNPADLKDKEKRKEQPVKPGPIPKAQ